MPGLALSIARAALSAALGAASWSAHHDLPITVWSDALHVVQGAPALQDTGDAAPSSAHMDLWIQLQDILCTQLAGRIEFRHVPAHLPPTLGQSPLKEWIATHNQWSDTIAVQTNLNLSLALSQAHHDACRLLFSQMGRTLRARKINFGIAAAQSEANNRMGQQAVVELEPEGGPALLPIVHRSALSDLLPIG